MVLSLRRRQIILGMLWLKKWNPAINWKRNTMTIPKTPLTTETTSVPQQYLVCWLGIDADTKINKHLRKRKLWKENESIDKITISAQIAQQSTPLETPMPDWCTNFSDVFSEQTHAKLPPHRHYDHTIDLQPTFTPRVWYEFAVEVGKSCERSYGFDGSGGLPCSSTTTRTWTFPQDLQMCL